MKSKKRIFIAGHNGMIGSAIYKKFKKNNHYKLLCENKNKLDLTNQQDVFNYLKKMKPDAVILAAAKVGGIHANNTQRARFIYDNISIQSNVVHGSYLSGVKNLIFLGSSCIYPRSSKQPIKESYLLSNYLEKTNEPYAIAKIAGLKLCENYSSQYNLNYKTLMPCNAYGENDNYDLKTSHFLPATIRKIVDAIRKNKNYIELWGNGKPKREFIFSDDIANACEFFLNKKTESKIFNIGSGIDYSVADYAKMIMRHLNVNLKIIYDKSKPNGTLKKLLDSSLANKNGWSPKISFEKGLSIVINDYLKNQLKKNF
tara:strand:- start:168 stop:1109 length:942 start_codon:yes stop_codon:yes gene_type:complete